MKSGKQRPIAVQYVRWVWKACRLGFDQSVKYNGDDVSEETGEG